MRAKRRSPVHSLSSENDPKRIECAREIAYNRLRFWVCASASIVARPSTLRFARFFSRAIETALQMSQIALSGALGDLPRKTRTIDGRTLLLLRAKLRNPRSFRC